MLSQDHPINNLIQELKSLPGIGAKSAQRIAYYIIGLSMDEVEKLAESIRNAKQGTSYCSICNNLTDINPCHYCSDDKRDDTFLCIVEEPFNIASIEKTGIYNGRYHVLLGTISPLKGIGPDELKIEKLLKRIRKGSFKEIILATSTTTDGEATAVYLAKSLKDHGIKITRLAIGLPVGSDIDYADQVTIKKALEGRAELKD
ncbi:MAG: recombination protein RecR [Candidatus Aminicenantes bacterium]|nr:recombination protein RecR [Candidatus Aminicenantes bacterium]